MSNFLRGLVFLLLLYQALWAGAMIACAITSVGSFLTILPEAVSFSFKFASIIFAFILALLGFLRLVGWLENKLK